MIAVLRYVGWSSTASLPLVAKYAAASPTVSITRPLLRVGGNASSETMVNPDNKSLSSGCRCGVGRN